MVSTGLFIGMLDVCVTHREALQEGLVRQQEVTLAAPHLDGLQTPLHGVFEACLPCLAAPRALVECGSVCLDAHPAPIPLLQCIGIALCSNDLHAFGTAPALLGCTAVSSCHMLLQSSLHFAFGVASTCLNVQGLCVTYFVMQALS